MKPAIARAHPADHILSIFDKLHEQSRDREAAWQTERERFRAEIEALKQGRGDPGEVTATVEREVARTLSLVDSINEKLTGTSLELSAEMRLIRERIELEAYLKGLRYSLSG